MEQKEFKKYKKELKGHSAHRKISNALASAIHGIKAPMEMRKKLEMAKKMKAKDRVDLDIHEENRGYGKRAKY